MNCEGKTVNDGLPPSGRIREKKRHWPLPSHSTFPFQCLPMAKPREKSLFKGAREMSFAGISNLDTELNRGRQGAGINGNRQMTGTWMENYFRAALDLELRIPNGSKP